MAFPPRIRQALENQARAMKTVHLEYHASRVSDVQPNFNEKGSFITDFDGGRSYWSCAKIGYDSNMKPQMQRTEACLYGGFLLWCPVGAMEWYPGESPGG